MILAHEVEKGHLANVGGMYGSGAEGGVFGEDVADDKTFQSGEEDRSV
jgi:hypothetical protein